VNLRCPGNMVPHVRKVLQGEYEVPYQHARPVIVDIGANVGGFAIWALSRWPGGFVHCYEPLPANFTLLAENIGQLSGSQVALYPFAIGDPARRRLFLGRNNAGEASLYELGEQSSEWVEVETKAPDVLPRADILKIDAEGAEMDILSRMGTIDVDVLMLEYHSEANRRAVDALLVDYQLIGGAVYAPDRGILKYAHAKMMREARG
jgi:FkbM family methyltransferase